MLNHIYLQLYVYVFTIISFPLGGVSGLGGWVKVRKRGVCRLDQQNSTTQHNNTQHDPVRAWGCKKNHTAPEIHPDYLVHHPGCSATCHQSVIISIIFPRSSSMKLTALFTCAIQASCRLQQSISNTFFQQESLKKKSFKCGTYNGLKGDLIRFWSTHFWP